MLNGIGGECSTIGGGMKNDNAGNCATIGGGYSNTLYSVVYATIGGGRENRILDRSTNAVIAGGLENIIGDYSVNATIGGGYLNEIGTNSLNTTIIGGYNNRIGSNCNHAVVLGGRDNMAAGYASVAFGRRAKATNDGAFVWGDNTDADVASVANASVTFRASGGYRLFSNSGLTLGAQLAANATSWSVLSDRNAKENFEPIDTREILEHVAELPLTAWNYKADPERRRYIGPVSQDFHAAFGLGNDTSINTLDTDGVALAAIKALYQENQELKARLAEVERKMEEMGR